MTSLKNERVSRDNIYYVYHHVDPLTGTKVYTGHGCKARAWTCNSSQGKTYIGGHRKPEHADWCLGLMKMGFTPADWVHIAKGGMSKSDACKLEHEFINKERPRFNYQIGDISCLSQTDKSLASELREDGLSYNNIAERLGVSTMTIWRYLNG